MNLFDALNWRYAVRKFSTEKIDEERIRKLLDATRLTATSYGLQPYRLIRVDDRAVREQLLDHAYGQEKLVECSHLVVLAAQTNIGDAMIERYIHALAESRNQAVDTLQGYADHIKEGFAAMSPAQKREWAHQQVHIALGTMLAAAAVLRIDTCPMGGIQPSEFDRVLGLQPLGLETSVVCALGVRHPEDATAQMKKVRYDHDDMVLSVQP